MCRALFIFAKLNPGLTYVQGMNELYAPLYYLCRHDSGAEDSEHAGPSKTPKKPIQNPRTSCVRRCTTCAAMVLAPRSRDHAGPCAVCKTVVGLAKAAA